MNITIIGMGYVGLVSAACFANCGINVICFDTDKNKIDKLNNGDIPIYEPGLSEYIANNIDRVHFTNSLKNIDTDIVFLCVGTPSKKDGSADLSDLTSAAMDIACKIHRYTVIVIKSTVPVGTNKKIAQLISDENPHAQFDICSNPEFLREGSAISDFFRPDRTVIGCESQRAKIVMRHFYSFIYEENTPMVFTSLETAELSKYASNAFLAAKLTFINEIADLCEKTGADIQDVSHIMGLDHRIGQHFLQAGPGFAGSCFPKDTLALINMARKSGSSMSLIESTININARRKESMAEKIIKACGGEVAGKTIAVLGLTFKANTNDMRDSISLDVIPALQKAGANIRAYDPQGMEDAKSMLESITWCRDAYDTMENSDATTILTEWDEFKELDFDRVKMKTIIDLRNLYSPQQMKKDGLNYTGIGRG